MKRIVSFVLAVMLLLAAMPALADDVRTSGDFEYIVKSNGTATVVGYQGTGDIIIPQMLDGYTVTAIGDKAFCGNEYSDNKVSVTLSDTIKTIGEFAFLGINVYSINIPDGLENIGNGAFWFCDNITYRISSNHPTFAVIDGALYDKSQKKLIYGKEGAAIPEGIREIGAYACSCVMDCGIDSRGIVLPSTIEVIGDYAFNYSIRDIEFDGDDSPYYEVVDYTEVKLLWGDNLREIGNYAFTGMELYFYNNNIKRLILPIPDSVVRIGKGCFKHFKMFGNIETMKIVISANSSLREISEEAFSNLLTYGGTKGEIKCDAPIVSIGEYAFSVSEHNSEKEHAALASFNFSNVESIGKGAFENSIISCSVDIPASCKIISEDAFRSAKIDDKKVTIAEGVEKIESNAFKDVDFGENSIMLPASLTYIAQDAFDKDEQFVVERGSYAYRWAEENAYNYTINGEEQNLDWPTN